MNPECHSSCAMTLSVETEFLIRTQGSLILLAGQGTPMISPASALGLQVCATTPDVFNGGSEEQIQVPTFVWHIL